MEKIIQQFETIKNQSIEVEIIESGIVDEINEEIDDNDENEKIYKWLSIAVGIIWILSFVIF
jgi:hypothetical protein